MKLFILLFLVSCGPRCINKEFVTVVEIADDCYRSKYSTHCSVKLSNGDIEIARNPIVGQKLVVCTQYEKEK